MSLIKWSDSMSVGIGVVDADHKKLVDMVNHLFDGVSAGKGKEAVGEILDGLIRYTVEHFNREERLFSQAGYPDTEAHKALHADLKRQALDIQAKYKAGEVGTLTLETMNFLKSWLINHIQGSDKAFAPFLIEKGIR